VHGASCSSRLNPRAHHNDAERTESILLVNRSSSTIHKRLRHENAQNLGLHVAVQGWARAVA
jgi:hypothetical protein